MQNRRRAKRAPTSIRGHILAHGRRVPAHIRNLSEKGALILVDTPLMEGADVEIDFNLKVDPTSEAANPFRTVGTVIWCNEDFDAGYQSGIRFDLSDSATENQLASFLDTVLS